MTRGFLFELGTKSFFASDFAFNIKVLPSNIQVLICDIQVLSCNIKVLLCDT